MAETWEDVCRIKCEAKVERLKAKLWQLSGSDLPLRAGGGRGIDRNGQEKRREG